MSLRDIMKTVVNGIAEPKTVYSVPSSVITDIFQPSSLCFRNRPELHFPMLAMLGMPDRRYNAKHIERNPDVAKLYLTHPNRTITRDELGHLGAKDEIESSEGIMYTRYLISDERSGFAVMLRDRMNSGAEYKSDRHGCIKLAMAGYFDNDSEFTVTGLMLPAHYLKDNARNQVLKPTPVHEHSVRGALYFANLCTEQLFNRTTFTPDHNFEQSKNIPAEHDLTVNIGPEKRETMKPGF